MPEDPPSRFWTEEGVAPRPDTRGSEVSVHSAQFYCEICGEETPHRILHLTPGSRPARMEGVARCQKCRTTLPFLVRSPREVPVRIIVSEGRESRTDTSAFPVGTVLSEGMPLPGSDAGKWIRRIDLKNGRRAHSAVVDQIGTIWIQWMRGGTVPLSIVEGRRTTSRRWSVDPETNLAVGDALQTDGESVFVVALRARHRTWVLRGDTFRAGEIERIYARRKRIPPAGSSAWSELRGRPSSPATATSISGRSRSSPGVRSPRRTPRERSESGGATDQSVSDS